MGWAAAQLDHMSALPHTDKEVEQQADLKHKISPQTGHSQVIPQREAGSNEL